MEKKNITKKEKKILQKKIAVDKKNKMENNVNNF